MITANSKMEQHTRCYFGGAATPKAPPPPEAPSPTDAADNARKRVDMVRRQKARGYQSTILTGPQGVQGQGKSLLGS